MRRVGLGRTECGKQQGEFLVVAHEADGGRPNVGRSSNPAPRMRPTVGVWTKR
jgi:hypothetical protein